MALSSVDFTAFREALRTALRVSSSRAASVSLSSTAYGSTACGSTDGVSRGLHRVPRMPLRARWRCSEVSTEFRGSAGGFVWISRLLGGFSGVQRSITRVAG